MLQENLQHCPGLRSGHHKRMIQLNSVKTKRVSCLVECNFGRYSFHRTLQQKLDAGFLVECKERSDVDKIKARYRIWMADSGEEVGQD